MSNKSYMNLDVTCSFAVEKLSQKDPVQVAASAGVEYDAEQGVFLLKHLGEDYKVTFPGGEVSCVQKEAEIPSTTRILILHYLATASGVPLQDKFISFKELPDGAIYIEPFTKRAIRPMLSLFAAKQQEFIELAGTIGGRQADVGEVSVTIAAFPRVPVTYVIWSGDDEFPASGNILFDASAPYYLPTEDYAVMAGSIIYHLGALLKKMA